MRKNARFKRAGTMLTAVLLGSALAVSPVMAASESSLSNSETVVSAPSSESVSENTESVNVDSSSSAAEAAESVISGAESTISANDTESTASTDEKSDDLAKASDSVVMYRLYNPNTGEHFYTGSTSERDFLGSIGWNKEGIAWYSPRTSTVPVYRLYNPNNGDHHYTTSASERDYLDSIGWNYEGVGWYSASSGQTPVYRLFNPNNYGPGAHHYTTSASERDYLKSIGWNYEGIGWYALKNSSSSSDDPKDPDKTKPVTVANGVDYSAVYNYDYYVTKYPDLKKAFGDNTQYALNHFISYGMKEGRQASEDFDVNSYRYQYSDLRRAFGNDLPSYYMHYIKHGKTEGRKATGVTTMQDPVTTYDGVDYSAVYNYEYYKANNAAAVKAAGGDDDYKLLEYFVTKGMKQRNQASEDFNVDSYRYRYPDLRRAFHNDFPQYYLHYIKNGKNEGRKATGTTSMQDPVTTYNGTDYSLVYDYEYYRTNNPSAVEACGGDDDYKLIEYFVTKGMNLEQQACATFNEKAYRHNNADLRKAFGSDKKAYYRHYITDGHKEPRNTLTDSDHWIGDKWQRTYNGVDLSSIYDYYYYRDNNPNVVADVTDNDDQLIKYFATTGIVKGQKAKSGVSSSSSQYKKILYMLHPELTSQENQIANNLSSTTKYCILVNRTAHKVYVYQGSKGNWTKILTSPCVVGKPSTPTYKGTFKTRRGGKYFNTGGYRCFYYTPFNGSIYFHSTIYTQTENPTREVDGTMSASVSHGCVRLPLQNAYWIYTNIGLNAIGTTVYVYDG